MQANLRRQSSVNQAGYFEDQEFLDNESAISVGVSMADIDGQFYDEYGLLEGEQAPDHSAAIKLGTGGASNESLTTESIHNRYPRVFVTITTRARHHCLPLTSTDRSLSSRDNCKLSNVSNGAH